MARCGGAALFPQGFAKVALMLLVLPLVQQPAHATSAENLFELRTQRTGCKNWNRIGIHKAHKVTGPKHCAELCGQTYGCVGFGLQVDNHCQNGSIEIGACMLWNGTCEDDSNGCFDDYTMTTPLTTTEAPTEAAEVGPDELRCTYLIGIHGAACPLGTLPLTVEECTLGSKRFGPARYEPYTPKKPNKTFGCFAEEGNKPYCKLCKVDSHCSNAVGNFGEQSCPAGTLRLSDKECLKAAESQNSLGSSLASPFKFTSVMASPFKFSSKDYPRGCIMSNSKFSYNAAMHGSRRNGTAPVCKKCGDDEDDIMIIRRFELADSALNPKPTYVNPGPWAAGVVAAFSAFVLGVCRRKCHQGVSEETVNWEGNDALMEASVSPVGA